MIYRNKRDDESFVREKNIETMKANEYLINGDIVLIATGANGYSFYNIVSQSNDGNKISLNNGLFAVLEPDPHRYTKSEIDLKINKVNNTSIKVTDGLTGGGKLSSDVTINIDALNKSEILNLLNVETLEQVFTLATERDIRNLFVGTRLEGGTEYKLSALSPDETKMVNMKLLSLFNDLILQKVGNDRNTLKNELTSLINSTKSALQSSIDLKEDKTKVAELLSALETKLNGLISLKADTTYVNSVKKTLENSIALKASTTDVNGIKKTLEDAINLRATIESVNKIKTDLTNLINGKAANTITITGTGALSGGGNLTANRTISHKDTSGFKHIPSGGAANQFLKWSADGIASWSAIAWSVITGKTNITVGTGLTGGGNIGNNVNINLDVLSSAEINTLLSTYKK